MTLSSDLTEQHLSSDGVLTPTKTVTGPVTCSVLTSEQDLSKLTADWQRLQAAHGRQPFADVEWFSSWWTHLGKPRGKELHIVTAEQEGEVVGILPLVVMRKTGVRIMQGPGLEAFFPSDALATSNEVLTALWDKAYQSRRYDFAMIRDVSRLAPSSSILRRFAKARDYEKAPILNSAWENGEAWFNSLVKKTRHEHKRHRRRLEEKGAVVTHIDRTGDWPPTLLESLVAQKSAWCVANKKFGLFDQPGAPLFFRDALQRAAEKGSLCFFWLTCGDHVVSYSLGFTHGKNYFAYLVSYDAAWMSFSPGNLLMVDTIRWALDNGFREFNFMQGEGSYKLRLTNSSEEYDEWTFARSFAGRLKERVYLYLRSLKRKKEERTRLSKKPSDAAPNASDAEPSAA